MYSTSNGYKEAILNAANLQWGYSIKANGVVIDSSEGDKLLQAYQQSCYYMNNLSVGNVVSQYINMTLRGTSFSLSDSVIEPSFVLDEQSVPMGKFNVFTAPVENGNTVVTAYDNVKKLDKAYTSVIAYPATIAQVVNEIAALCGVTFDLTGITYPSISIPKAYTLVTCSLVMAEICKLMGCNLVADRNGNLVFKWFTPSGVTYPIENHFSQRLYESDYVLGRLSCTTSSGTITSGDTGAYIIFTSDYMTQAQLDSIRTAIAMTYRGAELEISGDPSIDPWDIITVTDLDGNSHTVPVMNNILVFDGAIKNSIRAFAKTETESAYGTDASGTKKILEIQKSIDGIQVNLQENYTDNTQLETVITATASQVSSEVAQTVASGAIATIGAYTVTITTPNGTTYDDDNMSKTMTARVINKDADITTDLPTRAFSWTRQSLNTTADATWNKTARYGSTLSITSADYDDNCSFVCDVYINDVVNLTDTTGTVINDTTGSPITTLVPRLGLRAELALQSSFKQVKSTILQLSDKILLQIDNNGKLTSINMETGETSTVTVTADNINLNGLITANGNVKFLEDGSIECNKGTFNDEVKIKDKISLYSYFGSDTATEFDAISTYAEGVAGNVYLMLQIGQPQNTEISEENSTYFGGMRLKGTVYMDSSPNIVSDRNSKDNFTEFDDRYYQLAEKLHFQLFTYNGGISDRLHCGIIAQDLETALEECNIQTKEFAGLCIDAKGRYSVRYDEIYALMSWYMQEKTIKMENRIQALEERLGD